MHRFLYLSAFFSAFVVSVSTAVASDTGNDNGIKMDLSSHLGDNVVFYEGDKIRFLLSIDHNAYLYVFYQDATGRLHALLPNENAPPQYVEAGWFIPVPGPSFQFRVGKPYGEEKLLVFALSKRLHELEQGAIKISSSSTIEYVGRRFLELAKKNNLISGFAETRFKTEPIQ